jgi:hypothetical protein
MTLMRIDLIREFSSPAAEQSIGTGWGIGSGFGGAGSGFRPRKCRGALALARGSWAQVLYRHVKHGAVLCFTVLYHARTRVR